jgi:hypothetical protein
MVPSFRNAVAFSSMRSQAPHHVSALLQDPFLTRGFSPTRDICTTGLNPNCFYTYRLTHASELSECFQVFFSGVLPQPADA